MAFILLGRCWLLLLLTGGFQHSADALQTHASAASAVPASDLTACTDSESSLPSPIAQPNCGDPSWKASAAMNVLQYHASLSSLMEDDPESAASLHALATGRNNAKWTGGLAQSEPNTSCQFRGKWATNYGMHVAVDSSMVNDVHAQESLPLCFNGYEDCWGRKGAAEPDDTPGDLFTFYAANGSSKSVPFQYKIYVPAKCTPGNSLFNGACPLLVFLNGTDRGVVSRMLSCQSCQEESGVVTLLPSLGTCSSCTDGSCSWGNCTYEPRDWSHPFASENFVRPLVLQTVEKYAAEGKVDASRVIMSGASMGAVGAMYQAFASPDIYSKAFVFSPTNFGNPTSMQEFFEELKPLWDERTASCSRLKSVYTTVGSEDNVAYDGESSVGADKGILDWHNLAVFMDQLGVLQSQAMYFELRVLDNWTHETWPGGIHQWYDIFWQGQ